MNRRQFLSASMYGTGLLGLSLVGCRGHQYARVVKPGEKEMVGSHKAGSETFKPLVDEAVAKLLARHSHAPLQTVSYGPEALPAPQIRVCFLGVENKSSEEIGDFKEQLYQNIDSKIVESQVFVPISRHFVDAGLRETRLRPDQLFVPHNMRMFVDYMEQQGQPFDYMLYAVLTSGTTRENKNYQRDYLLTLELVNINSGAYDKQSAELSKGYHQSRVGRFSAMNPFRL
jgi:hypothetical protein